MSESLQDIIRRKAYYLWEEAGRPDGRADDFWSQAEREMNDDLRPEYDFYELLCRGNSRGIIIRGLDIYPMLNGISDEEVTIEMTERYRPLSGVRVEVHDI